MKAPPLRLILLLLFVLVVLVCSCSHNPKSFKESETIMRDRQEYVLANPAEIRTPRPRRTIPK